MRTARGFQSPQFPKTPKFSGYSQKKTRYRTNYQVLLRRDKSPKAIRLRCTRSVQGEATGHPTDGDRSTTLSMACPGKHGKPCEKAGKTHSIH